MSSRENAQTQDLSRNPKSWCNGVIPVAQTHSIPKPSTNRVGRLLVGLCNCGRRYPKPDTGCRCVTTSTPIEKPDLAIYSQQEQVANGGSPTWDNPDILTNHWRPFRLMEEARVKVRNLSPTTPAVNALVHFYTAPFGIGTPRSLRLTRVVSLGASQETELLFPLHQEVLKGDPRVGVHVDIEHSADANLINNNGSQVHDGGFTTESGRDFTVQIPAHNNSGLARQVDLSLLPTDLPASVAPISVNLAPFATVNVALHVTVPPGVTGTAANPVKKSVTVVGKDVNGAVVGGATRLVWVDD